MSRVLSSRAVGAFCLLCLPLAAQLPAPATAAAGTPPASPALASGPALSPRAAGYYEFALGKLDELQAESKGGGPLIEQAIQHYTAAAKADPDAVYIQLQLADLLSRIGRGAEAVTMTQGIVKAHPDSVDAHQALAQIYIRQLNDVTQASAPAAFAQTIAEYKTLVQLQPTNADNHLMLGKLYAAQQQWAPAEQEFRTTVQIAPTNDEAVSSLVQVLADQGRLDAAKQEIDSLPAAARSGRIYATLGDAYAQRQQYQAAAAAYRQAVALEPDDPEFERQLAQTLMDAGDNAGALTEYQRVIQDNPADGRSTVRVAQLEQQLGQFDAAEKTLQIASGLLPGDLEVGYTSALLHESEGKDDQAIADWKQLVAASAPRPGTPASDGLRRNHALFLDQLGSLQMKEGDYDEALATFQQLAANGAPGNQTHGMVREIDVYAEEHDYAKAIAAAKQDLQDPAFQSPAQARALRITYANLLAATGQTADAIAQIQPLLQGGPGDWDLYLALAGIKQQGRQYAEAGADASRAEELAGDDASRTRAALLLGSIEQKQAHYAQAEADYKHALDLAPGDPNGLNSLAYLLADQGVRLPEALGYAQQALRHDANNGAYLDTLGWIYFKMNRTPDAVANLRRAATLDRGDPTVLDHLAQAYNRSGQWQEAATAWQQAIALWKAGPVADYDAAKVDAAQKQLEEVKTRLAKAGGGA